MRASDSGTYSCTSSTSSASSYIVTSGSVATSTSITVALSVVIDVSYTPPEEGYQPPYYRAASPVTLTCRAVGTSGQIRYQWTSTCSNCFVPSGYSYSYSSHSISQSFLRSRDAGTHTCTAYDSSQRISGSASTVMNVVGAGIYVTNSRLSYSSSSLPNNSIITSYTGSVSYWSSYTRMGFYCCSNSATSGSTGTFIGINGNSYSGTINVARYGSSSSRAGCMRLYLQKRSYSNSQYYLSSSEEGIYTCRMPDSAGRSIDVSVGLYRHGYGIAPSITSLQRTSSTTNLTLTCTSTNSPATDVTWMKDGVTLATDGVKYKTYQTVTDRRTSTYQNTLVVDDVIENITGTYTCKVTNSFGSSSRVLTVSKEPENTVTIYTERSTVFAGSSYTLNCTVMSSEFHSVVKWTGLDGNPVHNTSSITVDAPVYDGSKTYVLVLRFPALRTSQAGTYTCHSVVSVPELVRTATKDVVVTVPTPRVHITRTPSTGVHTGTSTRLNLTCITVLNPEVDTPMTVTHSWRGPSGSISRYSSRPTVYNVTQAGQMYWSSILFSSGMRTSDSGTYYCTSSTSSASSYIVTSGSVAASTNITVVLSVVIDISYTSPEDGYQPPYYRAASHATLTCRAVGATSKIRYLWTSTCRGCSVPGGYYYSRSGSSRNLILRSRNAGTHYCSAYDSVQGISGNASTVMNIVGAGIYVTNSQLSYSSSSLPNNSIITSPAVQNVSSHQFAFYCCSNSNTSGSTGTFIGLDGNSYSGTINVEHYSSSHSYAGCMYLYLPGRYYFQNYSSFNEQGIYTCRMPDSAGRNIDVSVGLYRDDYTTAPRVTNLQRTDSTSILTLTCTSTFSPATNVTWTRDGDVLAIDGVMYKTYQTVTDRRTSTYQNILEVDNVVENINGNYTCRVTNTFGSSSRDLTVNREPALSVVIDVSYTPPEEGYQPPYYRAASTVTLTCRAVGATGRIRFRWTSTCSSCFVPGGYYYSYSSHSISESFLRSRDAGTHTCSAYDSGQRIRDSASTVMNIVGAGIYVNNSQLSYSSSSLPNNSIITSYTGYDSYRDSGTTLSFYCCSNSTSPGNTSTFIGLNGNSYPGKFTINRYNSSNSYAGCIYIYLYKHSYSNNVLSTSEQGIYTCRMPDSAGRNIDVSVGIYRQYYTTTPRVTSLHRTNSTTLTCTSTNSPATDVTWMKDGVTLATDGVKYKTYQIVTDRQNSTYQNTLVVDDVIENITGNYTCKVTNTFGSSSRDLKLGIHISSIQTPLTVSDTVSIVCSTDLDVETIEWIRDGVGVDNVAMNNDTVATNATVDNSRSQSLTLLLDPVSADHHNTQYTCRVTGPYGVEEKTVDITVQVPQDWATVQISTPPDDSAIVGRREFVMTCTVTVVRGLTVIPEVVWIGPDGNLTDTKNITMGHKQTSGVVTTRSLTLHSLQSSEGGQYSCMAAINISGFEIPPQTSSKRLTVISQALIQLKFERLQHYLNWANQQDIEGAVKEALTAVIREQCNCDFQSISIGSGKFSWQFNYIVYRTTINGTSDLHTAPQLLHFMEDWIRNEGTFLVGSFRLRVVPDCPLQIQSFHQPECMRDESTSTPTTESPTVTTGTPPVDMTPPLSAPLKVYFANNTPHVVENTVTVQVHTNKPSSATCRLGRVATMPCPPGNTAVFQNVPSGFYYLRVTATSGPEEGEVTWKVYVPTTSSICSVNLINTGLVVNGTSVSTEFRGMGPTSVFSCRLDDRQLHSCSSPLLYSGLSPGEHRIRILPQGCQQTQGQTFRFTV